MDGKVRVYEVAKALGLDPKHALALFLSIGVEVQNHMSLVDAAAVALLRRRLEDPSTAQRVREEQRRRVAAVLKEQEAARIREAAARARERQRRERRRERNENLREIAQQKEWAVAEEERQTELAIQMTAFGPEGFWRDDELDPALREKVLEARRLAEELYHARLDFKEHAQGLRGEAFADALDKVRAFDREFFALRDAWDRRWKRAGASETPPRCHDEKILAHMREATAWYRERAPDTYEDFRRPAKHDPSSMPPEHLPPVAQEVTRGARKARGPQWYPSAGTRVEDGRRVSLAVSLTEGTSEEDRPAREKVTLPRPRKKAPTLIPTPIQKRIAKRDEMEERLLQAIRENPGLALGALERQILRVKTGTMSGVLDRLLARGDAENRGSDKRPKYFAID